MKKLLSSLGFGGVEVDTVLSAPSVHPGEPLTGQVNLRAKSDVEITSIQLLIMAAGGASGEVELGRFPVASGLRLAGGTSQAVGFSVPTPWSAPMTALYGQHLPGVSVGVLTEVSVAAGSAKTDFDPTAVEPTAIHQSVLDALGAIGCRFVRNELRPGAMAGLPVPVAQSIVFWAPVPEGQPVGPHIPQLAFSFAADSDGLVVVAELAARPGSGSQHRVSNADAARYAEEPTGWVDTVDGWVCAALEKLGQAPQGSFLQQANMAPPQAGYGNRQQQQPYGYGGRGGQQGGYSYGGHRSRGGAGSMIAAGVGGAAMGFLGGMLISDMLTPDMPADVGADGGGDAGGDPGADAGGDYAAADYGGGDYGGDFGGDF